MTERNEEAPTVLCERWAPLDDWRTLTEVRQERLYPDWPDDAGGPPIVVVRQHLGTRELRVDVYGCEGGLDVTGTNGGVSKPDKRRGVRWFRDVRTCRDGLRRLTVRFMSDGDGRHLVLKS